MRKIERDMCQAIVDDRDHWCKANTSVSKDADGVHHVYLHGNEIAQVDDLNIKVRHCGWRTNTTKSRLNAILTTFGYGFDGVFQKDFMWYLHDSHTSTDTEMSYAHEWYELSNF